MPFTKKQKENLDRSAKIHQEDEQQKKQRETTEAIARSISALADSVKALINGPLKRKSLLVLLANSSGLSQTAVDQVLGALENLKKDHLN